MASCSGGNSSTGLSKLPASDFPYAHAPGATTIAGTGPSGFAGDGGPARSALLHGPEAVALDSAGDLFIADSDNCRVRMVPARNETAFGTHVRRGEILTVFGGPCAAAGAAADGRANFEASALALDPSGDLFVALGPAGRIEELASHNGASFGVEIVTGKTVTVAGGERTGYSGDGGPSTKSELDDPTGLAFDSEGDLLVSDTANCRVRLIAATSGTRYGVPVTAGNIYTVGGNGICGSAGDGGPAQSAEIWDPGALAVDAHDDVFVADQGNRSVRVLTAHAGSFFGVSLAADDVGTVAGEGSYGPYVADGLPANGQTAEINFPVGLAIDKTGDIYVADGQAHAIRFVADSAATLLGKQTEPGDMYTAAGTVQTGPIGAGAKWIETRVLDPAGLAIDSEGQLVFCDSGANVVRELPSGT